MRRLHVTPNKLAPLSVGHRQPLFEKCPGDSNIKPGLRTTEAAPPNFSFLIFVPGKIIPKCKIMVKTIPENVWKLAQDKYAHPFIHFPVIV